ncbi:FG-GAP repeat domain-containing protein [Nannocystis pusilla]|uniref:FG-GAP repeat domain-containing protein n=1 Tax=Nannocystis pusilla TaxID=889268 RepID=UPI003BF05731
MADLDADGILDLLVAGRVGLLALRGLGDLHYAPIGTALPYRVDGPLYWWEESARLCDRDGDPYPDVMLALRDFEPRRLDMQLFMVLTTGR